MSLNVKPVILAFALGCLGAACCSTIAAEPAKIRFEKVLLDPKFRSEGVAVADFNNDGKLDIAAGSVYYAAPDWKMTPIFAKAEEHNPKSYSGSFANFADDLNGDGWPDYILVGFPGEQTWWFENPRNQPGPWKKHLLTAVTNNESPQYVDIDGDGRRALIVAISPDPKQPDGPQRRMAILRRGDKPEDPWSIQTISAPAAANTTKYAHGLGVGDINGDGRKDVVVPQGWWENPGDRDVEEWTFHSAPLGQAAADMHVFDFNGDGKADVLSSSAHNYGIWWHEQTKEGWKTHTIDDSYSQTHALRLVDINGNGRPDFVTGKRWWAHGGRDPGGNDPAVMFWYELGGEPGKPTWTAHQFDHDSGPGTQFQVIDVNGDGLPDVVTSNKKGTHLFIQKRD